MKTHRFLLPGLNTARELSELLENADIDHNRIHITHQDHNRTMNNDLSSLHCIDTSSTALSGESGFIISIILATMVGLYTYHLFEGHPAGGIGTVFACLIALGLPSWLGGLMETSSENHRQQPYQDHIQEGGALVMVDINNPQEQSRLNEIISNYSPARPAGTATGR